MFTRLFQFGLLLFLFSCGAENNKPAPANQPSNKRQLEPLEEKEYYRQDDLPQWFSITFSKHNLQDSFQLITKGNLSYMNQDFTGDEKADMAILIKNKKSKEEGLLILNNEMPERYYLFGAGKAINGMTNLDWIDSFDMIFTGETISPFVVDSETEDIKGPDPEMAVTLAADAIDIQMKEGSGGAIIYWQDSTYHWMTQE